MTANSSFDQVVVGGIQMEHRAGLNRVPYHLLGLGISVGQKGRRKVSSVNIFYAIHVDHSRNPPLMVIGRTLTALVLSAVVAKTLRSLLTRTGVRFLLIIVLLIG